jgi:hypothetical protein
MGPSHCRTMRDAGRVCMKHSPHDARQPLPAVATLSTLVSVLLCKSQRGALATQSWWL